jgi:hypothetical protein
MIVCNYTKLFSIEFLHDFYGNPQDILNDITITPDEKTAQLMSGFRLKFKIDRNFLYCFVQTIASIENAGGIINIITDNKPLVRFDENSVLNFRINLKYSGFFDHSNLRRLDKNGKIFRFGNDSGNELNNLLFLSHEIPAYSSANDYKIGMLVTNVANNSFEAIRESSSADPHNTTENQFWQDITDFVQYVNQDDLVLDTEEDKSFASIKISFDKDLPNSFSLLEKSDDDEIDNTILGRDYLIHFKNNAVV